MTLGLPGDPFRNVLSILVYPVGLRRAGGALVRRLVDHREIGTTGRGMVSRAGDSRPGMKSAATRASRARGSNLVWHEFAHQIDMLDRSTNGTPPLADREQRQRWHDVMTDEVRTAGRRRRGRPGHAAGYIRRRERGRVLRGRDRVLFRLPRRTARTSIRGCTICCADITGRTRPSESLDGRDASSKLA